jgi:V8-like Glu-specific endopeptidase
MLVVDGFSGTAICTATVISDQLLLTAAHCVADIGGGSFVGFFTGTDINAPGAMSKVLPVASYTAHPGYPPGQPPGMLADYHDIGVAKLAQPTSIAPLRMIRPQEVGPLFKLGSSILIVGYGETDPSNQNSAGAKYQGTTTLDEIGSSEIYIGGGNTAQVCSGDSGGPSLADADGGAGNDWRIIGVASRGGEGCVHGAIETRVDAHLSWIHGFGSIPCDSGLSADCGPPPSPPAKKTIGETCASAADCEGNLCVVAEGRTVCSQTCTVGDPATCSPGYDCGALAGDTGGACVQAAAPRPPSPGALGELCTSNADCASGMCASSGPGQFCTENCTPAAGCGDTMDCVAAEDGVFVCAPRNAGSAGAAEANGKSGGGCSMSTSWVLPRSQVFFFLLLALVPLAARRRRA